jgi:CHAT domain-containing protein/tetratricopeptide (TPR) repeat protein
MNARKVYLTISLVIGALTLTELFWGSLNSRVTLQAIAQTTEDTDLIEAHKAEANQLLQQGIEQYDVGRYSEALESLQLALEIAYQFGDLRLQAKLLNNLGILYSALGQYEEAVALQEKALAITQAIGDHQGEAGVLGNLGQISNSLGDYASAITYQERALAISRQNGDRQSEASVLSNLGSAHNNIGQYFQAVELFEQSLKIRQEIGDRAGEANALNNLGVSYRGLGQYEKSLEVLMKSLTIRQEIGDSVGQYRTLSNIGEIFNLLGRFEDAISYFNEILTYSRELDDPIGEIDALVNLGNAYISLGYYPDGLVYQEQALFLAKKINYLPSEMNALLDIGDIYTLLGNYSEAIEIYDRSLSLSREIGNHSAEGESLHKLGRVYYYQNETSLAEEFVIQSIEVLSTLEPNIFNPETAPVFEIQTENYRMAQEIAYRYGRTIEALGLAEQSRSYEILSFLLSYNFDRRPASKSYEALISGSNIIRSARQNNATLVSYSVINPEVIRISVVQPDGTFHMRSVNLGQDLRLTELIEASRSASQFEIGRGDSETALALLVRGVRDSIGVDNTGSRREFVEINQAVQRETLESLHNLLVEPIADLLPVNPNDKIIFIPQGSLYLVPFAALQNSSGEYLIENHTILVASRFEILDNIENISGLASGNSTLIIGNPEMPEMRDQEDLALQGLSDLPGAELEAELVSELLNGNPLIGSLATETAISQQMPDAEIIHFATHGLLDVSDAEGLPIPGAIVLASDDSNDGFLTAVEILEMDLNADLVVLSACNTGLGRQIGDSVFGLPFAFSIAGVPNVVVSLWSVPDKSTALLMETFYQNLKKQVEEDPNKEPDKAQALRSAMLEMLRNEEFRNPLYWSAFTLVRS